MSRRQRRLPGELQHRYLALGNVCAGEACKTTRA